MKKALFLLFFFFLLSFNAYSVPINFIKSTESIGSVSGVVTYSAKSDTLGELHISLTNNSDLGGYITGFALNAPDNISLENIGFQDNDFYLLKEIEASPYGSFDIGASIDKNKFNGSGKPHGGIGKGSTKEFVFYVSSDSGLSSIDESSFFNKSLVVRMRGFENDGSDKLLYSTGELSYAPEPGTVVLFGTGLVFLFFLMKRSFGRKQKT
jgi:hypothetical protein